MPAFHRRKKSAGIVARIVACYGELELLLAFCMGSALASTRKPHPTHNRGSHRHRFQKAALKQLFSVRGDSDRIKIAKKSMHEAYFKSGLKSEYINTMGALGDCLNIRNLFAHCSWGQSKKQGLFFVNLEERAKKKGQLRFRFRHASSKTLRELEDYFWLTFQWLDYFSNEFCSRNALMLNHSFSIPQKIPVMKPYMKMFPHRRPH